MKNDAKQGFTLTEIMIVVSIIGLLASIATPSFINARSTSRMNACINNLRQLTGAKDQWAMENAKGETEPVVMNEVSLYMKGGIPTCPSGGTYNFTTVRMSATCTVGGHSQ
jgi:prepilin-type N-terminal cleavage/methylation domain-containing protein